MRMDVATDSTTIPFVATGRGMRGADGADVERERLRRLNELNRGLAAAADVGSMLERISSWLAPVAGHDLVVFHDRKKGRRMGHCSCHGPRREAAERAASGCGGANVFRRDFPIDRAATLSLIRCGRDIEVSDNELLREAMEAVGPPLRRALAHEDLFEMATSDALTGLANRRVFEGHVGPMIARALRQGTPLSLMALDLDRFKEINDSLGHGEGDRVLRMVARELARQVRKSDVLARMGGDEFSILLPDTTADEAAVLGERLRRAINSLGISDGRGNRLGVSIGIAQWRPGMGGGDWQRLADENLYRAKTEGRNRVAGDRGQETGKGKR